MRQLLLWAGHPFAEGAGKSQSVADELCKQMDFESSLKSHLELNPGIKPGLSLAKFSIPTQA